MAKREQIPPVTHQPMLRVAGQKTTAMDRWLAEEVPVALVYNGSTHAVMMATPIDLADFAVGFSLTEGIVDRAQEIESLDIVEHDAGAELRMWLAADPSRSHTERRRALIGPTGCGLCGIESLAEAVPRPRAVSSGCTVRAEDIRDAVAGLRPLQVLNQLTGAMHGAAFWQRDTGLRLIREDVGRHNALDKLAGALDREAVDAASGIVVLTSRVSVEMVQKAAAIGATIIAAVSAPTALAIRTAEAAGITLIGVARHDAFEVFTHAHRIAVRDADATRLEITAHA